MTGPKEANSAGPTVELSIDSVASDQSRHCTYNDPTEQDMTFGVGGMGRSAGGNFSWIISYSL